MAERRVTNGGIRRGNRDLSLRTQAGKRRTKFVRGKGGNLTFVLAGAFNLREQSIKRRDDGANFRWNSTGLDRTHVVGVSALKPKGHRTQWSKPAIEARPDEKAQERNDENRRGQQSLDNVGDELLPDSQPVADEYPYPFSRNFCGENAPCDAVNRTFRETRFTIAQARARGAACPRDKPTVQRPNLAVQLPLVVGYCQDVGRVGVLGWTCNVVACDKRGNHPSCLLQALVENVLDFVFGTDGDPTDGK